MLSTLRGRLTYANVVSTICLFVLLGGGAYAVTTAKKNSVTSKSVKNGSIKGVDVLDDGLTGQDVDEGSLDLSGAKGEKGEKGDPGTANVTMRTADSSGGFQTNNAEFAEAPCQPGEHIIAGGFQTFAHGSDIEVQAILSKPVIDDPPEFWEAGVLYSGPDDADAFIRTYAMCAAP